MRHIEGTREDEERDEKRDVARKENIAVTVKELEGDYNRCYSLIRKTFGYLEKLGLRDFNGFAKYKWTFDRDSTGLSYVCIRFGSSLRKKSLIKRSGNLSEEELYRWIDNKDLVLEALEEAYRFIDERLDKLKIEMAEMKEKIAGYEDRLEGVGRNFDESDAAKKVIGKRE
jgi:hypothetical protein